MKSEPQERFVRIKSDKHHAWIMYVQQEVGCSYQDAFDLVMSKGVAEIGLSTASQLVVKIHRKGF